ncbi:MAG: hypothetical protein J5521_11825 [Lachnospiraceae bacterium]|nr:hypothetical protein [Lachnospiraceae bacterium]
MRYRFLFATCLALAFVGCKKEHIEYFEDNTTIKKSFFTDGDEGPIVGVYKEYRSNGDLKEIRNYKNGSLEGKSFWFWKNDTVYEKNYVNGKLEGIQKFRGYNVTKNFDVIDSFQEYRYSAGKYTPDIENSVFIDPRDSLSYKTISIGGQTWFAENLRYETKGSYCYAGKKENCEKYGRLYTKNAARNACPEGWRIFSQGEFGKLGINSNGLLEYEEKIEKDGKISLTPKLDFFEYNLKSSSGWSKDEWNGGDKIGFSILPSGYYCPKGIEKGNVQFNGYGFYYEKGKTQYSFGLGSMAILWQKNEKDDLSFAGILGSAKDASVKCGGNSSSPIAIAIRCIKEP